FHFGEHQRGLAIGLHMAGTKLGPAIGAWIAVRLLVSSGWQAMFIILGIGSLLWLIPWLILAKDDDRKIERSAQSRTPAKSVSFGKLMASPVIWGTMIGTFCYMYFVYYCMTWMPAYFVEQRGLSLKSMGWYTFLSFAGMAAVSTLAGWAADRIIV